MTRSLTLSVLSGVEVEVTLLSLVTSRVLLLLHLRRLHHHHRLGSALVLTRSRRLVSSELPQVDFMNVVVTWIHVFYLVLDIVDLTHVHGLIEQMLSLNLFFVKCIRSFAGS